MKKNLAILVVTLLISSPFSVSAQTYTDAERATLIATLQQLIIILTQQIQAILQQQAQVLAQQQSFIDKFTAPSNPIPPAFIPVVTKPVISSLSFIKQPVPAPVKKFDGGYWVYPGVIEDWQLNHQTDTNWIISNRTETCNPPVENNTHPETGYIWEVHSGVTYTCTLSFTAVERALYEKAATTKQKLQAFEDSPHKATSQPYSFTVPQ